MDFYKEKIVLLEKESSIKRRKSYFKKRLLLREESLILKRLLWGEDCLFLKRDFF